MLHREVNSKNLKSYFFGLSRQDKKRIIEDQYRIAYSDFRFMLVEREAARDSDFPVFTSLVKHHRSGDEFSLIIGQHVDCQHILDAELRMYAQLAISDWESEESDEKIEQFYARLVKNGVRCKHVSTSDGISEHNLLNAISRHYTVGELRQEVERLAIPEFTIALYDLFGSYSEKHISKMHEELKEKISRFDGFNDKFQERMVLQASKLEKILLSRHKRSRTEGQHSGKELGI